VRTFSRTTQFKKDVKLADKRGKDLRKLRVVLDLLIDGGELPAQYRVIHCGETLPAAGTATLSRIGC